MKYIINIVHRKRSLIPIENSKFDPHQMRILKKHHYIVLSAGLISLAESISSAFIIVHASKILEYSSWLTSLFLGSMAASSIICTYLFGYAYDRAKNQNIIILLFAICLAGYASLAASNSVIAIMGAGVLLVGPGSAIFPLLYAFAKNRFASDPSTSVPTLFASMRIAGSTAWIVGPVFAGFSAAIDLRLVFSASAVVSFAAALSFLCMRPLTNHNNRTQHRENSNFELSAQRRTLPIYFSITLLLCYCIYSTTMFMGGNATTLFFLKEMSGNEAELGIILSFSAVFEIIFMITLSKAKYENILRRIILLSLISFFIYYILVSLASSFYYILFCQLWKSAAIAGMSIAGMLYIQKLFPHDPGQAAAMFESTINIGWLFAGIALSPLAHILEYRGLLTLCALMCVLAIILFTCTPKLKINET